MMMAGGAITAAIVAGTWRRRVVAVVLSSACLLLHRLRLARSGRPGPRRRSSRAQHRCCRLAAAGRGGGRPVEYPKDSARGPSSRNLLKKASRWRAVT
eukprot:COSAG01_NODE_497_length_16267_cov_5.357558_17_plen_98_part_00